MAPKMGVLARRRLIQDMEDRLLDGRSAREPFEIEWNLNLAFFQGEHWWGFRNGRFWTPRMEKWRVRFTENRVQPIVRNEVAKLTKQRPKWDAVAQGAGSDALPQAIMSMRALEAKWIELGMQRIHRQAVTWSRVCGAGFVKTAYDPDAAVRGGEEVALGPDGEGVINRSEGGFLRREQVPEAEQSRYRWVRLGGGDVCAAVRSPFDIYVDPLAGEAGLESAHWLIEEQVRSPEWVQETYDLPRPPKPDAAAAAGVVESRSPGGPGLGKQVGVTVYEMWERPSKRFPNGRRVTWCKGILLDVDEENVMAAGDLPYVMYRGIEVPGRFWPTSIVTGIRPLNAEGNKTRSQMRENAAKMSNPALLVPQSMMQAGFKYHGHPGEVIPFDEHDVARPDFLVPPGTPRSTIEEMGLINDAIDKVSHQSEASRGNVPVGVTAASAIQLLQEAGQTTIEMDAHDLEDCVSQLGQMILNLMCRYYTDERFLAIVGEDEPFNVTEFRADMLAGDVPSVQVKSGSMVPRSVAARQAVMEHILTLFLQNGVRMDPTALGNFLRQFEVGAVEDLIAGYTVDQRQISWENKQLMAGEEIPEPTMYENHEAHLRGHEDEMKTPEFRAAPEHVQERMQEHVDQTRKARMAKLIVEATEAAQLQAAQQKAMQEMAGQGPGSPEDQAAEAQEIEPGQEQGQGQAPQLDVSGGAPDAVEPSGSEPQQVDMLAMQQMVGQGVPAAPAAPAAPGTE